METQLQRLMDLFQDIGIELAVVQDAECAYPVDSIILAMREGNSKVRGFDGYYTEFAFTPAGDFIKAGIWG